MLLKYLCLFMLKKRKWCQVVHLISHDGIIHMEYIVRVSHQQHSQLKTRSKISDKRNGNYGYSYPQKGIFIKKSDHNKLRSFSLFCALFVKLISLCGNPDLTLLEQPWRIIFVSCSFPIHHPRRSWVICWFSIKSQEDWRGSGVRSLLLQLSFFCQSCSS